MGNVKSSYVMVNGVKTHYLEAGEGEPLVLLHGGEFGGCAELSWEYNIEELSKHFHVYAPDWLGFGKTEKVFDFNGMLERRIDHIRDFLKVMCIDSAHFMGNSMGGTLLLREAAKETPSWPLKKIVVVSGGGVIPENEAREILNSYDCTKEHMKKIIEVLFNDQEWANEEYINKRYQLSLEPGAWECTAAARFKSPSAQKKVSDFKKLSNVDYFNVKVPTFIIAGAKDKLRDPGYHKEIVEQLPNNKLYVFEHAGHCPNIECHEEFNNRVIEFLKEG
ncbi:alpha/beta fold hydrolase [Bacillus sp. M6-12]|uniref:alpha/beta fold hydrolase n=1 Tax=Bacillus sp. M6-12 TaxID=2054166 RepID=UPI0015E0872D|nr:alpha/beta hydrolase [Bacillus sp. M6-12]